MPQSEKENLIPALLYGAPSTRGVMCSTCVDQKTLRLLLLTEFAMLQKWRTPRIL